MHAVASDSCSRAWWLLVAITTACTTPAPSLEAALAGQAGTFWDIVAEVGPVEEEPRLVEGFYLLPTHRFYHYNYFGGYTKRTLFHVAPTAAKSHRSPPEWRLRDSVLLLPDTVQYKVRFLAPDTLRLAAFGPKRINSLVLVRSRRGN